MTQYQTFPDAAGSSKNLEKLQALRLPPLVGKSFLDVGCNEGFFCGFASHEGASMVVGMDSNQASVDHASTRFPDASFRKQSWDEPIDRQFDVILLASALHYAKDQAALIHKLMSHLTPGGTLVLEIGMANTPKNEWVTVKRSIDERQFPSRAKLSEILEPYAWKIMGTSVAQAGDPTPRVVIHVQERLPYAFLLMMPPAFGKSTIANVLGTAKGLKSISGDALIHQVSLGKHEVSDAFRALVQKDYCHTKIAWTITNIFENNLGEQWVDLWLSHAEHQDILIDAYIPQAYWDEVIDLVKQKGFAPIQLAWDRIGPPLLEQNNYKSRTLDYVKTLEASAKVSNATKSFTSRLVSGFLGKDKPHPTPSSKHAHDAADLPEDFDAAIYLDLHPDVAKAGMNPGYHYLRHGMQEGRRYK